VLSTFQTLETDGWMISTPEEQGKSSTLCIATLVKAMFRRKLDSEANFRLLFGCERAA
jgi:hypothetical protein